MNAPARKSGFVAVIGRPNVGKSTLLNHLVGQKLAGVSPKPQTTRNPVRGILTRPEGQIVYLDTPGLHNIRDLLGNWMIREIDKALEEADLVYWMVLPVMHPEDEKVLEKVKALKVPVFLLINQIDKYSKLEIIPVLDHYSKVYPFREFIPISARMGEQTDVLVQRTFEHLPVGPLHFPEDQISDQSERFLVTEMIREKIFKYTTEEIPYATAVVIEKFTDRNANMSDIEATIVVEKDSQKAILIGKKGEMLKQLGTTARLDIEKFLGRKVFLKLWVKTMEKWKRDENALKYLGYE